MPPRIALITGITGQDGSYLAELLLDKGYIVHGTVRRTSSLRRSRLQDLYSDPAIYGQRLFLHYADLDDPTTLRRVLGKVQPEELYHLAGQSHVGLSFEIPESTCDSTAMGALRLLEMIRDLPKPPRIYHASSSEIFGEPPSFPQDENTPMAPVNPYGCAKAFATQMVKVYRDAFGFFACNGITYNHESPRRGENFVTRKITLGAARIKAGRQACLALGNLDAQRDWGYAPEYVTAMWRILQAGQPRDYVLATGRACSVREFVLAAFSELGIGVQFEGQGAAEVGRRTDTGAVVVQVEARFQRPVESSALVGDASLARQVLGWSPQTMGTDVARLMARADAGFVAAEAAH